MALLRPTLQELKHFRGATKEKQATATVGKGVAVTYAPKRHGLLFAVQSNVAALGLYHWGQEPVQGAEEEKPKVSEELERCKGLPSQLSDY